MQHTALHPHCLCTRPPQGKCCLTATAGAASRIRTSTMAADMRRIQDAVALLMDGGRLKIDKRSVRNWSGQGCVLSFLNRRSILYKKGDVGITRLDNSGLRSELIREEDAENIIDYCACCGSRNHRFPWKSAL